MSAVTDVLERLHIPYVEKGANVKKGNVNVRCPFCTDDPSHHMGVWQERGSYSCWRDRNHRGGNFAKLVAACARISYDMAKSICSEYFGSWAQEGSFEKAVQSLSDQPKAETSTRAPREKSLGKWMRELLPISANDPLARRHRAYLSGRGFDPARVASRYSLLYAVGGEWRDRVVIPYFWNDKMVTWSARSLHQSHEIRYKALSDERSILTTKQVLYNFDRARKREGTLFVVEGPFDTMKFDYWVSLSPHRARTSVVGLSSVAMEDEQLVHLVELSDRYERVVLLMDPAEIGKATFMQGELGRKAEVFDWTFAGGYEDPGAFDKGITWKVAERYAANN